MVDDPYTVYWTVDQVKIRTFDSFSNINHFPFLQDNQAHGTVYLDDGVSFKYRDSSDYNYYSIDINGDDVTVSYVKQ
jgi:hypothetical protein